MEQGLEVHALIRKMGSEIRSGRPRRQTDLAAPVRAEGREGKVRGERNDRKRYER